MKIKNPRLQLPVVSLGAEHMVMGYLMRRNILTYKAPPNNEGYDLICIHPDPRKASKQLRIQVKSRYQTDSDRGVLLNAKSLDAFDFLIVAFMNIGYYMGKSKSHSVMEGYREPEFYTFPAAWARQHHKISPKGGGSIYTRNLDIEKFRNEAGFESIARKLKIPYPSKEQPG
jgi:hypothetical protein